jgi:hypothetical protein
MSQPDRRNTSPRKRILDWLDPSSKWTQDEYGALPSAASEPYDWTLKDSEGRSTQVIPINSAVRDGSTRLQWLKRKANLTEALRRKADVSESSTLIPLKKGSNRKIFSKRITSFLRPTPTSPLVQSDETIPLVKSDATTNPLADNDGTEARRKTPGLALLLLLAVIALFVFAYIAQK